jgi:hypothetical protein
VEVGFQLFKLKPLSVPDSITVYDESGLIPITTSTYVSGGDKIEEEITEYDETKWEYAELNEPNAVAWAVITFGFTRISEQYIRHVKKTVRKKYGPDGDLLEESDPEYSYTPWVANGVRKQAKGWGGSPGETTQFNIAKGLTVGGSIQLPDKGANPKVFPSSEQPKVDSVWETPVVAEKQAGYDFQLTGRSETSEGRLSYVEGLGFNSRQKYLDASVTNGPEPGDIIIRPGVSVHDVWAAGYGLDSHIYEISPEQLSKSKTPGSVGKTPDDYDFMVITEIRESSRKTIQSGSGTYDLGQIRTWAEVYQIE